LARDCERPFQPAQRAPSSSKVELEPRVRLIVTVPVNGSAASSDTRASSSSADTTLPCPALRGEQQLQDPELLRAQLQAPSGAAGGAPGRVEHDLAALQHRRDARLRAACQRTDPRDQHREVERLGQVVISAQPEPVEGSSLVAAAVGINSRLARRPRPAAHRPGHREGRAGRDRARSRRSR